ncbi:hypothetical protein UVI_02062510 [Ustilaginoidea virens]|nr:hypothetical protein UVI_02062510 [Ustilaginoidea virens]
MRHLNSQTVSEYERSGAKSTFSDAKTDGKTPPGLLRLFALYENLTRFSQPFCTQLSDRECPDVPVSMSTNIIDASGVGLKQFWNLKNHMQAASQLATAHYPETLDKIFVVGAPPFFGTVWGWIKRWFDPMTVSKIFVLSPHEVKPTLEAFIEPRNIPKKYGGELDFGFGRPCVPDPSWDGVVSWENGYTSFPSGPLSWEEVDDGQRVACVALGKEGGKPRNVIICTMPKLWPPRMDERDSHQTESEKATTNQGSEPTQAAQGAMDEGDETVGAFTNGHFEEKMRLAGETNESASLAQTATAA